MFKFTRDSDLDLETYDRRINQQNFVLIDKDKMQSIHRYEKSRMETNSKLAQRTMKASGSYGYTDLGKNCVLSYLVDIEKCPDNAFRKKGVESDSLDMKKVLIPLYNRGYAREFLGFYMAYSSLKSKCSRIEGTIKYLYESGVSDHTGKQLDKLNFSVGKQQNLRFNYRDQDLISIPKEYATCFTVEDGYVLGWGDFAQSDFRIAYNLLIRDERNAPIMDACEDKYEGIARVVADFFGESFDVEVFRQERDLYKVYVLACIYGQRHGDSEKAQDFIAKFAKYLDSCPRYVEYQSRITSRIALGLPLPVQGYFGHEEFVPNEAAWKKNDTMNKALNTPVQTGTSEIVILTVNEILNRFYALGYTEEDISVYMVRHDEPIFKIKKSVLKDAWVFNQASSIIVDNWTPLKHSYNFGYVYKVEDEEIQDYVKSVYEQNMDKIEIFEPDEEGTDYWPLPAAFMIYVGTAEVGEKTIATLYDRYAKKAAHLVISSTDKNEVYQVIRNKLQEKQQEIFDLGYRGIVVYTDMAKEEFFDNLHYVKVTDSSDSHKQYAQFLAHYMAYRYAKKNGIEFNADMRSIEANEKSVVSVGELSVLQR